MSNERTRELERSHSETDKLISACVHDLQEPLRKIVSFGELLERRSGGALDAASRRFLERMVEGSRRMSRLIEDLQRFAKLGAGPQELGRVELEECAREAVRALRTAIADTGAVVELGPLPPVKGDPLQLRLLVTQLLSNALKFRSPERTPRVAISALNRTDGLAELSVSDNGIGFDELESEGLFEPFRRLVPRTDYPGSALGLASCRRIALGHGGDIRARSKPGDGSTFTVTLPLWSAR